LLIKGMGEMINALIGFIITLFDFRVYGFDVLPDFIGFTLLFLGFRSISNINLHFMRVKNLSIPMILVTMFDFYKIQPRNGFGSYESKDIVFLAIDLTIMIMNIIIIYQIFRGIRESAMQKGCNQFARTAQMLWRWQLGLNIAGFTLVSFIFKMPILIIAYIATMYVVAALSVRCVWKYRNMHRLWYPDAIDKKIFKKTVLNDN